MAGDEDTHANHGKSIFGDRKSGKTAIVEGDSNTKFGNRGPIGEKAIFHLDLNGGSHGLDRDWLIVALSISESGIRDDQIVVGAIGEIGRETRVNPTGINVDMRIRRAVQ